MKLTFLYRWSRNFFAHRLALIVNNGNFNYKTLKCLDDFEMNYNNINRKSPNQSPNQSPNKSLNKTSMNVTN